MSDNKQEPQMKDLLQKVKIVMEKYKKEFPDVKVDRDYFPFKVSEEWGECLQVYLMLTDRGRQKEKSKKEIKSLLEQELADVLGFILLFADNEGIDLSEALQNKWFTYLEKPVEDL